MLEHEPSIILCYSKSNIIDEQSKHIGAYEDDLNFRSPRPHERLHDFFKINGSRYGGQIFGVVRVSALKMTLMHGNYRQADGVLLAELVLMGEFYQVPEYLYYKRIHPKKSTAANHTDEAFAVWFDPKNQGKIVLPTWRRYFEYYRAINNVQISWYERGRCYPEVLQRLLSSRSEKERKQMKKELRKALKNLSTESYKIIRRNQIRGNF